MNILDLNLNINMRRELCKNSERKKILRPSIVPTIGTILVNEAIFRFWSILEYGIIIGILCYILTPRHDGEYVYFESKGIDRVVTSYHVVACYKTQ